MSNTRSNTNFLKANSTPMPKQRTCRLCAEDGYNFVSIFHGEDDIRRMVKCLPVQIRPCDDLPHHICPSCRDALDVTYNLNVLSLKAHLRLLEKVQKPIKQEVTSPRRQASSPKSFRDDNRLQLRTYSSKAHQSKRYSGESSRRNLSILFDNISGVRTENNSVNVSEKEANKHNASFSVKEEPIDPDFAGFAETEYSLPAKRKVKIERDLDIASQPGTSRLRPRVGPSTSRQYVSVKQEPAPVTQKRMYVKAVELECSECRRIFLSTSISITKRKRILEGGAAPICSTCGKLGKKTILPEGPAAKRPRYEDTNDELVSDNKNRRFLKNPAVKYPAALRPKIKQEKIEPEKALVNKVRRANPLMELTCKDCGRHFRRQYTMQEHIVKYHVPYEQWKDVCTKCNTRFYSAYFLAKHQERNCGPRNFECTFCTRTFQYDWCLNRHVKIIHANTVGKA